MDTNKYSNGKIYKIVHNDGRCYIGSTIKTLEQRLKFHHWHYNKYLKDIQNNDKVKGIYTSYQILSDLDPDSYKIELIMDYPCSSVKELENKEKEIIKSTDCVNKYGKMNSYDTKTYYNKYYKEHTKKYKDYYDSKKDAIKEYYNSKKTNVTCDVCKCEVLNLSYKGHLQSAKHIKRINLQNVHECS